MGPLTYNPNILQQGILARQAPRKQLEGYELAQMVGIIPGAGLVGVAGDINQYVKEPETRGILPYALTAAGALPFLGILAKMAGPMQRGILQQRQSGAIAYHGSPHQFDKFDMNKVGTGEGAQAYGHGLYFAENPNVAKSYQFAGQAAFANNRTAEMAYRAFDATGDHAKAKDWLFKRAQEAPAEHRQMYYDAMNNYETFQKQANLYKVDIPDSSISKMLDWDKPIVNEAKQRVLALLPEHKKDLSGAVTGADRTARYVSLSRGWRDMTGAELYGLLERDMGAGKASQLLREAGFPGIKYLDAGSRTAGKGTSNYVVFDDALPKIVGRE